MTANNEAQLAAVMKILKDPEQRCFDHEELYDLFGVEDGEGPFAVSNKLAQLMSTATLTGVQKTKLFHMMKELNMFLTEFFFDECMELDSDIEEEI